MKKVALLILVFFLVVPCYPSLSSDDSSSKEVLKKLAKTIKSSKLGKLSNVNDSGAPEQKYLSTVYQKIHDHWVLPKDKKYDKNLEVVVVITIQNTGNIEQVKFEKKSTNNQYNNFVVETVLSSNPLPKFPPEFKKDSMEMGLRFKPGEL